MPSRLTIDLDAMAHNHAVLKDAAGGAEVAPVIKADGYGLGVGPIARRLWAEGARTFFVARLVEGEALRRELGERTAAILVLDGAAPGSDERLRAAKLTPVLNTLDQARAWRGGEIVLHIDTGMNRSGVTLAEANALAREGLKPDLVMSHLGSAAIPDDPRNAAQLDLFCKAISLFPDARASLSASSGIYLGPAFRFDMVRPGISLFGGGPRETPVSWLKPVATLTATILDVRDLKAGDQAGYGSTFTAARDMRIAVLDCGYADGLLRASHRGAAGWLAGARTPLVFVTMDLTAVDVTGCPHARAGDDVELLGQNAPLDDLAAAAGTAAHECLVRLGQRGERRVLGAAD